MPDEESFYARWAEPSGEPAPGYTILMMVPADLPVFLRLALDVCAAQDPAHCVETLVVPDRPVPAFTELAEAWARDCPAGPVRVVNVRPADVFLVRRVSASHVNWIQMVRGVEAARSTHALWHDCDLFITDRRFLRAHYETCAARGLACLGVAEAWDPWYAQHGLDHIVATWEMMFSVSWMRSFPPLEWWSRTERVAGVTHVLDNTFWPQCQTPADRIDRHRGPLGLVHLGAVMCEYRRFQISRGPFADPHFRLLAIRLLVDACDPTGWPCDVPPLDDLVRSLTDTSSRVAYWRPDAGEHYRWSRRKLGLIMDSGLLRGEQVRVLREGVRPFDRAFGHDG